MAISPRQPLIRASIQQIALDYKAEDGGIGTTRGLKKCDLCVNGMFLSYACYFGLAEEDLHSVVDFILSQQMEDGGCNCQKNRSGARHSSLHSTLSALEGTREYVANSYKYRIAELQQAAAQSREFILQHHLFKSDRTGEVINADFVRLPCPPRWRFSVLRALDYFRSAGIPYNDRMRDALDVLRAKSRPDGRWRLFAAHRGKVHFVMERAGEPSRWNTLLALRVLKVYGDAK